MGEGRASGQGRREAAGFGPTLGGVTVYLVGAGPGDPGLLTVRGRELLERADVVVHDRLSAAELLDLAPPRAERIDVGKAPGHHRRTQDEINAILVEHGRAGRTVVRLKGGDPFVFARGGEEAEALAGAGVAFEVVPGITSALAVPAYAGIPVTLRYSSTSFTVVTGHEDPTKDGEVDWEAVARLGGTIVLLMAVANWPAIARRLVAAGLGPDTPAAAVRWGTRADQRTTLATLATLADHELASPSVIVVGEVAARHADLAWFDRRPLFGRSIVVTRARAQASAMSARLRELGADVLVFRVI
jgi:uroporphyrinogen III methyltransferase/synthase